MCFYSIFCHIYNFKMWFLNINLTQTQTTKVFSAGVNYGTMWGHHNILYSSYYF